MLYITEGETTFPNKVKMKVKHNIQFQNDAANTIENNVFTF